MPIMRSWKLHCLNRRKLAYYWKHEGEGENTQTTIVNIHRKINVYNELKDTQGNSTLKVRGHIGVISKRSWNSQVEGTIKCTNNERMIINLFVILHDRAVFQIRVHVLLWCLCIYTYVHMYALCEGVCVRTRICLSFRWVAFTGRHWKFCLAAKSHAYLIVRSAASGLPSVTLSTRRLVWTLGRRYGAPNRTPLLISCTIICLPFTCITDTRRRY